MNKLPGGIKLKEMRLVAGMVGAEEEVRVPMKPIMESTEYGTVRMSSEKTPGSVPIRNRRTGARFYYTEMKRPVEYNPVGLIDLLKNVQTKINLWEHYSVLVSMVHGYIREFDTGGRLRSRKIKEITKLLVNAWPDIKDDEDSRCLIESLVGKAIYES